MDIPPDLTVDRIAAALLVLGAGLYAKLSSDKKPALPAAHPACTCTTDILATEERIKNYVASMQVEVVHQLAATHKHANLLPEIQRQVGILLDRIRRS